MCWLASFLAFMAVVLPVPAAAQDVPFYRVVHGSANTTVVGARVAVADSIIPAVRVDTVRGTVRLPVLGPAGSSVDTRHLATQYPLGKPFGPFSLFSGNSTIQPGPWGLTLQASSPSGILTQIQAARARGVHLVLAMTGGSHAKYTTDGKFDIAKWEGVQARYNTAAIKAAVESAVQDGTILGASVLDEPNHPSWGGVPTPALLDTMSQYVKSIFPTLRTAAVVQWTWYSTTPFTNLDFLISQYSYRLGPPAAYVDSAVASTKRRGVGLMFSMNVLNGGTRADPCPAGSYESRNCMMTPTEILEAGKALLGSGACALLAWKYDEAFMDRPENVAAFTALATYAQRQPAPPCQRP